MMQRRWIFVGAAVLASCGLWLLGADRDTVRTVHPDSRARASGEAGLLTGTLPVDAKRMESSRPAKVDPTPRDVLVLPKHAAGLVRVSLHYDGRTPREVQARWKEYAAAWLLPAGFSGQEIDSVAAASLSTGTTDLQAPSEGHYDVYVRCGPHKHVERGVWLGADVHPTVRFVPPDMGTVRIHLTERQMDGVVQLEFIRAGDGSDVHTHRADRARIQEGAIDHDIPFGSSFRVFPWFNKRDNRWSVLDEEHEIVCEPATVRAGDVLKVSIQPRSKVTVLIHQIYEVHVDLKLIQRGEHENYIEIFGRHTKRAVFFAKDGPAELRWGERTKRITVDGDTSITLEIRKEPWSPEPENRLVCALPPDADERPKKEIQVSWIHQDFGWRRPMTSRARWVRRTESEAPQEASTRLVRSSPIKLGTLGMVRWGAYMATLPELTDGATHVVLTRGGWIQVPPTFVATKIGSNPRLRRRDGRGFWSVGDSADDSIELNAGLRVGPLMPGDHTFEVWIGAVKMGDVKATVVAGETRLLNIR